MAKTALIRKMHLKYQVDTVSILNTSILPQKFTKIRKNALLDLDFYLGIIYWFFLVSFGEMQKFLQGEESHVYRKK